MEHVCLRVQDDRPFQLACFLLREQLLQAEYIYL